MTRILTAAASGALALLAMAAILSPAAAQPFPSQVIKLVVPTAPGGSSDILARSLAHAIQQQTGATVIVDNKGGAGGAIGVAAVASAPADGYTLLVTAPDGMTVLPHLRKDIPYQPQRDFIPIGFMAETPWLFAVTASLPVRNLAEFVQAAKAKPGSIRYASPGVGTSAHLITERLRAAAGIEMLNVPYKGSGPATAAVVNGEVDLIATSPINLKALMEDGRLRGLAVTAGQRLPVIPDVPTMIESGFPGFAASAWYGVFAPSGVPADRVARLDEIVAAAAAHSDFRRQVVVMGLSSRAMSRAGFAAFVAADSAMWKKVIEKSKTTLNE